MNDTQISYALAVLKSKEISQRTINMLHRGLPWKTMDSIEDLRGMLDSEILEIRQLGEFGLREVRHHYPFDPDYKKRDVLQQGRIAYQWMESLRNNQCPQCGVKIKELTLDGSAVIAKPCNHLLHQG